MEGFNEPVVKRRRGNPIPGKYDAIYAVETVDKAGVIKNEENT